MVSVQGSFWWVYGTSCSTPVLGAMITAINDARLSIGKRPVGFINPAVRHPSSGKTSYSLPLDSFIRLCSKVSSMTSPPGPILDVALQDSMPPLVGIQSQGWGRLTSPRCYRGSCYCLETRAASSLRSQTSSA